METQFILGIALLVMGFILGWKFNTIFFNWFWISPCHCGSGEEYVSCCYERDVKESEDLNESR